MNFYARTAILASGLALILAATPTFAEVVKYKADLSGTEEVPPTETAGAGTSDISYDTDSKMLTWTITYEGLSGEATAAHFHGPAAVGANADPVVPIDGALTSPIAGEATLTDAQAAELDGGMWYFNVHTAKFPDGEIRGQIVK